MVDYGESIRAHLVILDKFYKHKELFNQERDVLSICKKRYEMSYAQIHENLAYRKTEKAESEILEIIRSIIRTDLPICEIKIERFKKAKEVYRIRRDKEKEDKCSKYLIEWLDLHEKLWALISFRSLEHFAQYMEWDKSENDKIWKYSIDTFNDKGYSGCTKGFFYYANKMVLGNDIRFILKQLPTSFGKTYSDSIMIAFIFGKDKSEQVIKVVGNRSLQPKATLQVVNIMTSKRYLQVFPDYARGIDLEKDISSQIFSTCTIKEGMLTIVGSGRDTSFECFSKECNRDGIRGGYLFLDDIVQRSERMKIKEHNKDIEAFNGTWKKRSRDEKCFKIVCGGTTYDPYDLLCDLKYRYSKGKMVKSNINKYTTLSLSGDAVFVCVPKLDENDNLTFPQKTVLSSVLEDRKNDYELFMAMDMQQPIAPKDTPFYWNYLKEYEYIPSDSSDYCLAVLDPARTGANYVSMPIFKKVEEIDDKGLKVEKFYLINALYQMQPMDNLYSYICELVERHHIVKLHIERNTDTSLKFLLDKMLHERGIYFCEISEVYSVKVKEGRIYANETLIKNKIVFPERDMYGRNSEIGIFMEHIISYKYTGADYDDSIDSVSLFVDKFINKKANKIGVRILKV